MSNYFPFTVGFFVIKIYSLSELFLLGFVIEGFYAQNEKNKQTDVEEIKDLCNKVFVSILYIFGIFIKKKNIKTSFSEL